MYRNILLFVSDAVPYMVKAGKAINTFPPKMIHLTFLVHAFHRIRETILFKYIKVDEVICQKASYSQKGIFKSS